MKKDRKAKEEIHECQKRIARLMEENGIESTSFEIHTRSGKNISIDCRLYGPGEKNKV